MIKVNLLSERPEAAIYRKLERAFWIFWFLSPILIFLWAYCQRHRTGQEGN